MPTGFGNHHQSEAIPNALPKRQNSPQQCPLGLYAEQLSGSAFTKARASNLKSWLYRLLPSVVHEDYEPYPHGFVKPFLPHLAPNPWRWSAFKPPKAEQDFVHGLLHIAGNSKLNTYLYQCNTSMIDSYFMNQDGELLLVPYDGKIHLKTEFGELIISPGMCAVIPRGVFFKVELSQAHAEGYVCENMGSPLTLPELGIIGANGLANPRHFIYPEAQFENINKQVKLLCKSMNACWIASARHSPLNVVAWHGNYAPYAYDLSLFTTINSVSFDHLDPSIFTVLTSLSDTPGVANMDFVIFPSRWVVAENTFRPPYFHRNIMSEWMGLVTGTYDAKKDGFEIGGISIHNRMTAHGPDAETYQTESHRKLKPEYYQNTLAFMFESCEPWQITLDAMNHPSRQTNYSKCWQGLGLVELELK